MHNTHPHRAEAERERSREMIYGEDLDFSFPLTPGRLRDSDIYIQTHCKKKEGRVLLPAENREMQRER
jgi:hypothetical protein